LNKKVLWLDKSQSNMATQPEQWHPALLLYLASGEDRIPHELDPKTLT